MERKTGVGHDTAWNSQELQDQAHRACEKWPIKLQLCIQKDGDNNFKG